MKRYLFEFEFGGNNVPSGTLIGCGVTAYSYDDAKTLLRTIVFKKGPLPKIKKVIENVDVSTLDKGHVLPNMAPPNLRGIWFPLGYAG
jgi:hypothetical protein